MYFRLPDIYNRLVIIIVPISLWKRLGDFAEVTKMGEPGVNSRFYHHTMCFLALKIPPDTTPTCPFVSMAHTYLPSPFSGLRGFGMMQASELSQVFGKVPISFESVVLLRTPKGWEWWLKDSSEVQVKTWKWHCLFHKLYCKGHFNDSSFSFLWN